MKHILISLAVGAISVISTSAISSELDDHFKYLAADLQSRGFDCQYIIGTDLTNDTSVIQIICAQNADGTGEVTRFEMNTETQITTPLPAAE